jgi:hypothetical protein
VYAFLGTDSTRAGHMVKSQMKWVEPLPSVLPSSKCWQYSMTHSWFPTDIEGLIVSFYRTNYALSQDPDEGMEIVDDAVSFVKNTMSSLKSDSSGLFTVCSPLSYLVSLSEHVFLDFCIKQDLSSKCHAHVSTAWISCHEECSPPAERHTMDFLHHWTLARRLPSDSRCNRDWPRDREVRPIQSSLS